MSTKKAGLGPVLLTVLLDLLGFGLVIPLVSFYSESYGATESLAIALMGMYSLAQFFFAPVWGSLSDRYGRRPIMLMSIGATALMLAAFASAEPLAVLLAPAMGMTGGDPTATGFAGDTATLTLGLMFAFRFMHGVFAANISTAQAYVADVTTPENRAKGMGLIGASFGVGFTLGPWMGGELSSLFDHTVPIWVAAGLSVINLVWAIVGLPEPERRDQAHQGRSLSPTRMLSAFAHPAVGLAIGLTFLATLAFAMMEYTFPLVAEHVWSMREHDVGRLFGLLGVIGIVIQGGLIRRLVPRYGEAALLKVGLVLNAIGLTALAFVGGGAPLYLAVAIVGTGVSLVNPSLQSLISRGADDSEQGRILGANQSLSALARAVAPWVAMAVYAGWFRGGAFLLGAALFALALVLAVPAAARAQAAEHAKP